MVSCSNNDIIQPTQTSSNDNNDESELWLVPVSEVKDGGPGKDGIPSIDNPIFIQPNEATYVNDSDLVIGTFINGKAKAYPHSILDWHEIINDKISNDSLVTISYCPLTGTAFAWEGSTNGEKTSFGVSGLLYNANLILYDRNTDSNWSQLGLRCINGSLKGKRPKSLKVIETNWKTWKTLYPTTKVLSNETGFSRSYSQYPYGNYRTNNNYFIFKPELENDDLPSKKRVYAIINQIEGIDDQSKIYKFEDFTNGLAIKDTFLAKKYLVVGNENLLYSFEITNEFSDLTFEYNFNDNNVFFSDNEGNDWSVYGEAINGPRKGKTLTPSVSVVSYWFAIAAFYPNPKIYSK